MPLSPLILLNGKLTGWDGSIYGTPPEPTDPFTLGVTIPTAENTGVLPNVARTAYTGPTTITGSQDPLLPTLIENKNITSRITIFSGHVRFYNCYYSGGGNETGNGAQCQMWAVGINRVEFERCTFRPTNTSYYLNAVIGHHYTLKRCDISRVVDAAGAYNQYGERVDVRIEGCYMHHLVRYEEDGGMHADGTHNDFLQLQGGEGVWFIGNALYGYNLYADGSVPTGKSRYAGQGFLTQQNVPYPAGSSTYYMADIHCLNNWFWGIQTAVRIATRSSNVTTYDAEVKNNTWMDMPYDTGYSIPYYTIRPTTNVTVNGIAYPGDIQVLTADVNNNKFDTGADVLPAYRGQPVGVRCDLGG